MKSYIVDLKTRIAVYIPVKNDLIDKKLAEYINTYPDRQKLKIMFLRESEGVYEFGSKRITVKVERDTIQVKVGGGYLTIDEFLDTYTSVELERIEKRVAQHKSETCHIGSEKLPMKMSQIKSL